MVVSMSNTRCISSQASRGADVFDLSATSLSIPEQSHVFAVATFTPQAMQLYSAVFEATMDVTSRYMSYNCVCFFSLLFVFYWTLFIGFCNSIQLLHQRSSIVIILKFKKDNLKKQHLKYCYKPELLKWHTKEKQTDKQIIIYKKLSNSKERCLGAVRIALLTTARVPTLYIVWKV